MKRVIQFKAVNRGFPVNITSFIVHRDNLLVLSVIQIVRWYLGVLGVAFEMHERRFLSIYIENSGRGLLVHLNLLDWKTHL